MRPLPPKLRRGEFTEGHQRSHPDPHTRASHRNHRVNPQPVHRRPDWHPLRRPGGRRETGLTGPSPGPRLRGKEDGGGRTGESDPGSQLGGQFSPRTRESRHFTPVPVLRGSRTLDSLFTGGGTRRERRAEGARGRAGEGGVGVAGSRWGWGVACHARGGHRSPVSSGWPAPPPLPPHPSSGRRLPSSRYFSGAPAEWVRAPTP